MKYEKAFFFLCTHGLNQSKSQKDSCVSVAEKDCARLAAHWRTYFVITENNNQVALV